MHVALVTLCTVSGSVWVSVCVYTIASPFTHAVSSMKVLKGNVKKNVWLFGPTFEKIISLNDEKLIQSTGLMTVAKALFPGYVREISGTP